MALESKYRAPGDTHDILKYTDAALDIINGSLLVGAGVSVFVFPPAAPIFAAMAAVGAFIQFFVGLIPDPRPNPVLVKFKELEKAIHKLEEQMVSQFADMLAFISEHNFDVNIATDVSVLMSFMRDCLKYHDKQDVDNFAKTYEKNSPLRLAYSMASLLENDHTNPLMMAMAKDNVKTKTTFNKWKNTIMGIMGQILFIESFAQGLLKKSKHDENQIAAEHDEFTKSFQKWENKFKENQDPAYWGEFKEYLVPYAENHVHLNNSQKADEIKAKLDTYFTTDSFYIIVFHQTKWHHDYTYSCKDENDHIAGAWDKGLCNVLVYRSKKGSKKDQNTYDKMRKQMEMCSQKTNWAHELKDILFNQIVYDVKEPWQFCCLMAPECYEQIRYLNHLDGSNNKGPGYYDIITRPTVGGPKRNVMMFLAFE